MTSFQFRSTRLFRRMRTASLPTVVIGMMPSAYASSDVGESACYRDKPP